jgi:hypothetical protein
MSMHIKLSTREMIVHASRLEGFQAIQISEDFLPNCRIYYLFIYFATIDIYIHTHLKLNKTENKSMNTSWPGAHNCL